MIRRPTGRAVLPTLEPFPLPPPPFLPFLSILLSLPGSSRSWTLVFGDAPLLLIMYRSDGLFNLFVDFAELRRDKRDRFELAFGMRGDF